MIGGHDITQVELNSLRKTISVVPQVRLEST